MCVGFWSLSHPDYALVLCTNRDEWMTRPTQPAHWHSFNHHEESFEANSSDGSVLSGIDITAGGTWFGINKRGKIALLTNITEPAANLVSSRGHLVSSFLFHNECGLDVDLKKFVNELLATDTLYSGFNLLLLSPSFTSHSGTGASDKEADNNLLHYDVALLSNGGAGKPVASLPPRRGSDTCSGMSNGTHDGRDTFTGEIREPEWPKVAEGRLLLSQILAKKQSEEELIESLFWLLRRKIDSPPGSRGEFRRNIMIDAVRHVFSKIPYYVQADNTEIDSEHTFYATRLSTVLLVRRTGDVLFIERDEWVYDETWIPKLAEAKAGDRHERRFHFKI